MKNILHDNFKTIYRFAYDFARVSISSLLLVI